MMVGLNQRSKLLFFCEKREWWISTEFGMLKYSLVLSILNSQVSYRWLACGCLSLSGCPSPHKISFVLSRLSHRFVLVCIIGALYVADATYIQDISSDIVLSAGSRLVLQCVAIGSPAPQVTWAHQHRSLSSVPHLILSHSRETDEGGLVGQSNVTVAVVTTSDKGQYTCIANNTIGPEVKQNVIVTVQSKCRLLPKPSLQCCGMYVNWCIRVNTVSWTFF